MTKRIILGISAILLLVAWQTGNAAAAPAKKNTCLNCHTNGEILKSLYKPPAVTGAEEGEG